VRPEGLYTWLIYVYSSLCQLVAVLCDKTVFLKAVCVKFYISYFDVYLNSKQCSNFPMWRSSSVSPPHTHTHSNFCFNVVL
jgi:hypothetical protein